MKVIWVLQKLVLLGLVVARTMLETVLKLQLYVFQLKCKNNVSSGYSKCLDEGGKSNRKRFKQGEKLRPQPKDFQMILDRAKELLEIVPN